MEKRDISSIRTFENNLCFAITKAKKPLIWIESFDYPYIITLLCSLKYEGWIWHESSGLVLDLQTHSAFCFNGQNEFSTDTLAECIFDLSLSPKYKILVAKVSEHLFSAEPRLVPSLQDFVYDNNQEDTTDKQIIVLISNTHFDVTGLEHICERFTLPTPDIEDIDEELGVIQDAYFKTRRDEYPEIHPDDDRIIKVGDDLENHVIPENDEKGRYYNLINKEKGLIRRDDNGNVERVFLPQVRKYKFGSGFLSRQIRNTDGKRIEISLETRYQELVESLRGMHLYDIKELLGFIMAKGDGKIKSKNGDQPLTKFIRERKKQIANNSGLLEVIDYEKDYWKQVADIDNLLKYIDREKERIDTPNNYPPKLPKPKGILLVGAPGCGKSASVPAIASKLDKPLFRLNIGTLLGHKYGQSENRFIEALHTADASAPCVLWIDEIEKAFAGAGNESENDDTLTHIVGHFLTWMQEHKTMVYLVATANDISRMKPEMLRKGRWDETFYLNYPSFDGCKAIINTISAKKFEIGLRKQGSDINIDTIANVMCRIPMGGAEIENTISETVKDYSIYKDGEWYIHIEDIALTLINYLLERNEFKDIDINKKEIDERNFIYIRKKFNDYCENKDSKTDHENDDDDLFLSMKVDAEIQDMKIQRFGSLTKKDEPILREFLMEKYKKQYNFKSASIKKSR